MKLVKGFLLVMLGHVLRLGAGMVVFVMLARVLGPTDFGNFSYWLAIATLLSIPVNYGFGTAVLRSFGMEPASATRTMSEVFTAKVVLGAAIVLVGLVSLLWVPGPFKPLFFFLLAAQLFESFTEFFTLGFRAKSHFSQETVTASLASSWHIAVMLLTILLVPDINFAAGAFAFSRVSGLLFTRYRCHKFFGPIKAAPTSSVLPTLRKSWAYAFELGLFTTYGQLDTLMINFVLGPTTLGLYQAGMKLVQGASRIAPVLAQVLLPDLARHHANSAAFRKTGTRAIFVFSCVGLAGCLVMWWAATPITDLVFGAKYAGLANLLPLFGLILFLRFVETGLGLLLVARDLQSLKVWLVAIQLVIMLAGGLYVLNMTGLVGWQWLNIATLVGLLFAYVWLLSRGHK